MISLPPPPNLNANDDAMPLHLVTMTFNTAHLRWPFRDLDHGVPKSQLFLQDTGQVSSVQYTFHEH